MKTVLAAAGLLFVSTAAFAQSSPAAFTEKAASGGMFEIQSSEMILKDGATDPKVKEFATQMIADHEKAAADLKAAAEKSGVSVPTTLASKEATKLKQLSEETGDKQKLYVTQQILAHNDAVVLHRGYAESGTDANLKAYAEKALPVLEEHSKHVDMMKPAM
jgi:putative membrane protein